MTIKDIMCALIVLIMYMPDAQSKENSRPYTIEVLTGDKLREFMPFVITQRILTFSAYPYLYVGNFVEEKNDFKSFAGAPDSALAIAYHGETPVGLLTGCSFSYYASHFNDDPSVFKKEGVDPKKCYYFPEIIVLSEYRGNKLSCRLLEALEGYAKKIGYEKGSLITESHETHPLKPNNYKSLDALWNFHKYRKTSIDVRIGWRTYQPDGSVRYQKHKLNYWVKDFKSVGDQK